MGQRAEPGLSLQPCRDIPQKDTAALPNSGPSNHNNTHGGRGVTLDDGNGRATRENKNTHTAKTNKCMKVERALFTASKCLCGGLLFNLQQLKILILSVTFGFNRRDLH